MTNEILIQRLNDDDGARVHLISGTAGEAGNFNVTITPVPEGDVLDAVLSVLTDGWEQHEEAYPVPAWDSLNGVIHVGTTVRRNGFVVDVARSFVAAELPADTRRSEIVRNVRERLSARPALRDMDA